MASVITENVLPISGKLSGIPVVNNVVTDEDIGLVGSTSFDPVSITRAVNLLTDPHSRDLKKRHLHILKKVTDQYHKGFFIKDLVQIFHVINSCAELYETHEEYLFPLLEMVSICARPFLMERNSDEIAFRHIIVDSVSQLGYLLRVNNSSLRIQICKTLTSIYENDNQVKGLEYKTPNLDYIKNIVEDSGVADTVVKSLALISNPDINTRAAVFKLLKIFSSDSPTNCKFMLEAGAAYIICSRLNSFDDHDDHIYLSTEVLWNLLDNGDESLLIEQLDNMPCIKALHDAFLMEVPKTYSKHHRIVRNDILVLANLIANKFPNAPFIETGFVKSVLLLITFQELKSSHHALVKHLRMSKCNEDFEFKKIALSLVINFLKNRATHRMILEHKLLSVVFSYMKPIPLSHEIWLPSQFEEIQLQSIALLCSLAEIFPEEVINIGGIEILIKFICWCFSDEMDFKSHGNSFYGAGGRHSKNAQLKYSLRVIHSLLTTRNSSVFEKLFSEEFLMQVLLHLNKLVSAFENQQFLNDSDDTTPSLIDKEDENAAVSLDILCDELFLISILSEEFSSQLFATDNFIDILCRLLKINPKLICQGLGHPKLILATTDCIWAAVISNYESQLLFLEKEGAFLLIDLIESSQRNIQSVVLGCLLDLMENPKTIPHVLTWVGKNQIKAPKLMIDIWIDEESRIGVSRTQHGAIENTEKPLMGQIQEVEGFVSQPSKNISLAILDVSENIRAKVYGFFCRIGFTEISGLDATDYVWLTCIEKYLDFKNAEVWQEIAEELKLEDIMPISPDRQALEAIIRLSSSRAKSVQKSQKELLTNHFAQENSDEQTMYANIRLVRRQHQKMLEDFNSYIKRTSDYNYLCQAKREQDQAIAYSRINEDYVSDENFHRTDIPGLNTTYFASRHVRCERNVAHLQESARSNSYTASARREPHFKEED